MSDNEEACPICGNMARRGKDRDYGDKERFFCPRCGPFEISRTALAMLDRRLKQDDLAPARLSHAIRHSTSDANPFFVSSSNIDDLTQQPLPSGDMQVHQLLRWLASQLGEDKFGQLRAPSTEHLAAIVGAIDGHRVERLIAYAEKQGWVVRDRQRRIGLSPEGWKMAAPAKPEANRRAPVSERPTALELVKADCNTCGPKKNAFRRAIHSAPGEEDEIAWSETYEILECCGCNGLSVRKTFWFSENDEYDNDPITGEARRIPGIEESYWPPPTKRAKPEWAGELADEVLRRVIDEVYQALNSGLIVMASIGTRTLLDRAMFLSVGDPRGGFSGKLDLMVEQGFIGKSERDILEIITDAGSAAAHRGFAPTVEHLNTIVTTAENFLLREFILKPAADKVRAATPRKTQDGK